MAKGLIEREKEREWLAAARREAVAGRGSLVLLAGDSGTGKTALALDAFGEPEDPGFHFLRGAARPVGVAYGPLVGALRGHLRAEPAALDSCGPLGPHLSVLLPELGDAPESSDRATLFEALRCALTSIARDRPAVLLLDDLQWSDETTLALLGTLAAPLREMPVLIVAAYRSDSIPASHPLRRLRNELRRDGNLEELELSPLSPGGTRELAERALGAPASPALAQVLHDRTGGVPFFVEEMAAGLEAGGRLQSGDEGLVLELDADVPLPETIRDAVLLRTGELSAEAREAAEAAAVAGARFNPELLIEVGCEGALGELLDGGLISEPAPGQAEFRHPLVRDAIYEDIPWVRRRSLHRDLAAAVESRGGAHAEVAYHWLAAQDTDKALDSLVRSIDERESVYAYGDAARCAREALDLWPDRERAAERIAILERYARLSELSGDLAEAARSQREVVSARRTENAGRALADAERRLAGLYELQGDRERALAARRVSADAFAAGDLPAEAAIERLIAAGYLQSAGSHSEAIEAAVRAGEEAETAERLDLRARAYGLEGVARAKGGDFDEGLETIKRGLSLALDNELSLAAAEVYQRLGTAREITGDYSGANEALVTAVGFCETDGGEAQEYTCLSCIAYVLRELGDWEEAERMSHELRPPGASADSTLVADGVLGAIHAFRGEWAAARPLLERCLATASRLDVVSMGVDSAAALAFLEDAEGDAAQAASHCRFVLERWQRSEDHHYAVWGLRWAAGFFARRGDLDEARACTDALSGIATSAGHPDAVAALAHALAETALAEGHAETAADQLDRAAEMHDSLDIPFERAQIQLRAGVALAAAGRREEGLRRLAQAHSGARKLGAAPLAAEAAAEVTAMGESVEEQLGTRAAAAHENGGLSRRELEVMRMVAAGQTNREIADHLVLSTRTIDMHVRNILAKLGCRSRTEAAAKAGDLGLLA